MKNILVVVGIFLLIQTVLSNQAVSQERAEPESKSHSCVAAGAAQSSYQANPMRSLCQSSCAIANYDPKDLVDPMEAKVGDLTTCPVSEVVFRVTANSSRVSFGEQKYYTCCSTCAGLFDAEPQKFVRN